MEFTHIVKVSFGLQTSVEFTAANMETSGEKYLSFFRVEEDGTILSTQGAICVNLETNKIVFSYDVFDFNFDIHKMKQVDDNYHFTCVNDLSRVDVYICEYNRWVEEEEGIFTC